MTESAERRAVVLGAGTAGLLAARVLAESHDQVTVVDRDDLPASTEPRRGVPQAQHAHALLARGQQILEELFPGLTEELELEGAMTGAFLGDTRMLLSGERLRSGPSGLIALSASRGLLEGRIRARVRELPGVRLLPRSQAVGIRHDGGIVTGVRLKPRSTDGPGDFLEARTVVDATGRTSRAPAWLEAIGCPAPAEEKVPIDLAYATRRYRLGSDSLKGDLAVVHGLTASHPRGGVLALLEGEQGIVTLAGIVGDRPPSDPDGFELYAKSLQFGDIGDVISGAQPIDDPVTYRFASSTWRHYERARGLPEGFAVMGDALCSFNPIYGQGMTIAALETLVLRRHLEQHGRIRPSPFHRHVARVVRPAWRMATGADVLLPQLDRRPTRGQQVLGAYVRRLHARAAKDETLSRSFVRVSGLVDRPEALFRPRVARRVFGPSPRH